MNIFYAKMSYIKKKKLFSYLYTSKLHRHEHRKKTTTHRYRRRRICRILLAKRINPEKFRVTLVDRKNFHAFPPLFYQIASSGLEPAAICFPFRKELRKLRHVRFHMGEALAVDTQKQILTTNTGNINYDYLVLATGTTNNFFNMPRN